MLGLIEISDDVLLVAGMDIPNIKNVKIGLQTLRLLNTPMEKLRLVLNRANSKVKLDVGEVERTLGIQAAVAHPERRRRAPGRQQGRAGRARAPPGPGVTQAIDQLADIFLPVTADKRKRR